MRYKTDANKPPTIDRSNTITGDDVLIVIPTLNEEAHIWNVITTLQKDPRCSRALIVISDGGSADQTVAIVERMGVADPRIRVLT
jgi:succinoglycan biosynthesis protein ExoA